MSWCSRAGIGWLSGWLSAEWLKDYVDGMPEERHGWEHAMPSLQYPHLSCVSSGITNTFHAHSQALLADHKTVFWCLVIARLRSILFHCSLWISQIRNALIKYCWECLALLVCMCFCVRAVLFQSPVPLSVYLCGLVKIDYRQMLCLSEYRFHIAACCDLPTELMFQLETWIPNLTYPSVQWIENRIERLESMGRLPP